jgi:hypothetical protein
LLFEELENGDFIPACSMLININCQRAIGLYDIEIGVEDWDFLLRIAQSQWEMHYEYKLYSFYRRLNNSLWNIKNESMLINTLKAYLKHQIWKKNDSVLNYYRKFKYLNLTQKSKVGIFLFSNKRYDLMFFYCLYQIPVIKILTQRLYKKYMIS